MFGGPLPGEEGGGKSMTGEGNSYEASYLEVG